MTVDITMILDRSGSMECIEEQVVASFNDFLLEQKKVDGKAIISLVQFDDQYEVNYTAIDLQQAEELNKETYQPRGMTALHDAIGCTIVSTKKRLAKAKKHGNSAKVSSDRKVIVVITTDGMENASVEYSQKQIHAMIKECEDKLGWKFIYLAADEDSFNQHEGYGVQYDHAFKMGRGKKAYGHANKLMSMKMANWRVSGCSADLDFTETERTQANRDDKH